MPYLSITDGRIARYDSRVSPNNIEGIYTDSFSSCNIIILYLATEEFTKISMIHADKSINPNDVAGEISWAGEECNRIVARRHYNSHSKARMNAAIGSLQGFADIEIDSEVTGIAVGCVDGGKLQYFSKRNLPQLITHPMEWQITSHYKLNLVFSSSKDLNYTKLLFDSERWMVLSEHDKSLMPEINSAILDFKMFLSDDTEEPDFYDLERMTSSVKNFFKNHYKHGARHYNFLYDYNYIALYFQQKLTENNYELFFQKKLRESVLHYKQKIEDGEDDDLTEQDRLLYEEFFPSFFNMSYKVAMMNIANYDDQSLKDHFFDIVEDVIITCHHGDSQKWCCPDINFSSTSLRSVSSALYSPRQSVPASNRQAGLF